MKKHLLLAAAVTSIFAFSIFSKCSKTDLPRRVLVFSKTAGYRHASIPTGVAALRKICEANGISLDSTENAADFNEPNLKKYAAVIFLSTTGDVLNRDQEIAFEKYIRAGGGFVGIHAATDTEYDWAWFGGLVGGYFNGHPAPQDATIRVLDAAHLSTKCLGDSTWRRFDEWYNFKNLNPDVEVLLNLDEATYSGGSMGANHPIAWSHEYDGGRAFYTAGGHTSESFAEPLFLQHIFGGLVFAMGAVAPENLKLCSVFDLPVGKFIF